jgi:NADPH:quinone reductase
MRALMFERFGGPEVLSIAELPVPQPAPGTAVVRMHAIGVNFADVYRRRGDYHIDGQPPYILGYEGAGVIETIDANGAAPELAGQITVGTRVGFADVPRANAELVRAPLDKLIPLPTAISFETAAALLLQGLTAEYLVRDSHRVRAGETVLVHAAAGGVGLLLVQLAKLMGGRVLALASSADKQAAAAAVGADEVAGYQEWVAAAQRFAPGGVDVVYDSIGATLDDSLRAARTGGHVVFFGMAGGNPRPVDPRLLMDQSKSLTGGDLWNVLTSHAERVRRAGDLFGWLQEGRLRLQIARRLGLAEGAEAHRLLEGRSVIGKLILTV